MPAGIAATDGQRMSSGSEAPVNADGLVAVDDAPCVDRVGQVGKLAGSVGRPWGASR